MGSIDYGTAGGNIFKAPVMGLEDKGHGFTGVIWDATTRQSSDYESGKLKWFVNKRLVLADEKPEGGQPVYDYIFHVAVKGGRGTFTVRDSEGNPIKGSSGKNTKEVRTVELEDVAIIASNKWLIDAVRREKLNTGHEVRVERLTVGRDENGDRMTNVEVDVQVLGTVGNPKPYKQESGSVDYDDAPAEPEKAYAGF